MGVRSGRIRVADLTFRVFDRAPHPDWFGVLGYRRVESAGWLADLRIIEGGHAIVWSSGDSQVAEVLSAPDALPPNRSQLHRSGLRIERGLRLRPGPGADYQACVEVERLDAEVFAHLADELALDASPGDLVVAGASAGRMDPSPISRIHVEGRADGLSVQAFHTFPTELAIVRTQSLFEIRGRGRP